MPAILLHNPIMLIRLAAVSIVPRTVTYGLATVCSTANPVPITNSPVKKTPYVRMYAAGTNSTVPNAMSHSPTVTLFLYPILPISLAAGMDITRYAI